MVSGVVLEISMVQGVVPECAFAMFFAATILGLYNVFDNPRQVFAAILAAADYRVLSSQPVPSCPSTPPFFLRYACSSRPFPGNQVSRSSELA